MSIAAPHPPATLPDTPGPEEALLGAMLLDPRVTRTVAGVVKSPESFASQTNGVIFGCLVQLHERGQTGNLVELATLLRGRACGGPEYLKRLALAAPPPSTALELAKQVADRHKLRKMGRGG